MQNTMQSKDCLDCSFLVGGGGFHRRAGDPDLDHHVLGAEAAFDSRGLDHHVLEGTLAPFDCRALVADCGIDYRSRGGEVGLEDCTQCSLEERNENEADFDCESVLHVHDSRLDLDHRIHLVGQRIHLVGQRIHHVGPRIHHVGPHCMISKAAHGYVDHQL
jgi:hypothetical protein